MAAPAPKASAYDAHVSREMSSRAFEARQAPAFKAAVGEKTFTPQQVQQTRTTYYSTVYRDRYVPAPSGASYGSFSEQFMWAMMWNAIFAHNHSDDPDYRRWRRDAEERAASDERVRDQLAELDRKVSEMSSQPKDPAYVPPDVPPEVAFSEAALTSGSDRGGYSVFFWLMLATALSGVGFAVLFFVKSRQRRWA